MKTTAHLIRGERSFSFYREFRSLRSWSFSVIKYFRITWRNPRNYWKVMKHRLAKEENELVTRCNQLKLLAADGKRYLTDFLGNFLLLRYLKSLTYNSVAELRECYYFFNTHNLLVFYIFLIFAGIFCVSYVEIQMTDIKTNMIRMMKETNIQLQVTSTIAGDDGEALGKSEKTRRKWLPKSSFIALRIVSEQQLRSVGWSERTDDFAVPITERSTP